MSVGICRALSFALVFLVLPAAAAPAPPQKGSQAYERSRTELYPWEKQLPTVAQVNADNAHFFNSRLQSIDRIAAFEVLLNAVTTYATGEGGWYVEPPIVKAKVNGYAQAVRDTMQNACPAPCTNSPFMDEQRQQADPDFIYKTLSRYFSPEYVKAVRVSVPPPSPSPSDNSGTYFLYFVGGILALSFFILWLISKFRAAGEQLPPLSKNYGTAAWAAVRQKPLSGDDVSHGVTFGKSSRPDIPADAPGAPVVSLPETHTLIVARTRAGKGTRVIVPTLLRYGGSMLVIDPKGENAAITARTRRDQLGQTVHIVNPWGEMKTRYESLGFTSASFNPLDALDRTDPNAVAFAQSLAAIICPPATGKDQYWQGSAANVLAGVFLWLAETANEQKTLARARQIVTMSRADFGKILAGMAASEAYQGAISEMVSQYIDLAPETYSGIMSNLAEQTKFLSDPQVKASTASSSFSMKTLREKATTVYLVIPHDRIQTHATWLRLVIAAAMQGMKSHKGETAARYRCMFLIDEFGSIGRIDDIPRDIALMSGHGLDFTLIVQGLDQLKDHYGDARGTILSNCAFKWFCFVNELETAKYLSESLGKATVRTVGTSKSSSEGRRGGTTGESVNYGETGRSLLTPDEILNLGRDAAILLNPRGLPEYLRPVDYTKLADTYAYLKPEYPGLYWEPPLRFDDNPYYNQKQQQQQQPPRGNSRMARAEALKVLGLQEGATESEISAAYKRLMMKTHPDTGGTDYFAQKLNEAREVLLG